MSGMVAGIADCMAGLRMLTTKVRIECIWNLDGWVGFRRLYIIYPLYCYCCSDNSTDD